MKVRYVYPQNGYIPDQETAKEYLTLGGIYNVRCTKIGKFHTKYYLAGIPGIAFNSVMFEKEVKKDI
jgi:hypothetical protein